MKQYSADQLRNVALIGHGGAGKTSLAESLLFTTGAISRQGKVDDGNTTTDFDPEEIKRNISIQTALAPTEWDNHKINLLDTPGYADFIGEVISALRAVDGAVVVVDGVSGVEVQTEKVWHHADQNGLPRLVVVTRLDKEHSDYFEVLAGLERSFGAKVIPVQIPIGAESGFRGVVDLVSRKAYVYRDGKPEEQPVPDETSDQTDTYREKLVERVAETDDQLLEKYLEGEEELSEGEIRKALKNAVAAGDLIPVLAVSSTGRVGTAQLLSTIVDLMPSPTEVDGVTGADPKTGEETSRQPKASGPLTALVFKTMADPYVGKLTYFRVYSGVLKADSSVLNVSKGKKERVGHVFSMLGKNQTNVSEVAGGDIGVAPKIESTSAGDTISDEANPILLPPIEFPEAVFSVAVEPKSKGDEEKLSTSLSKLAEEDRTLIVRRDAETHETVVSGLGDMHLEVILDRLHRKFGVEAHLSAPKIPYRETVRGNSQVQGKYKKQTGGRGQYGDVWLRLEPVSRGEGFDFVNKIVGGVVPRQYIPAVEKGVREAMEGGVVAGFPTVDIRVTLYDGSFHPVDSSEMAFKIAGSMAFKKGILDAKPVLLEPIMTVEVVVPDEYMGDVSGDLSRKRGKILGMEPRGANQTVRAHVPLAELSKYSTELRSITHGRASYSMSFDRYEEVPHELAEKVIEEHKKEEEQ